MPEKLDLSQALKKSAADLLDWFEQNDIHDVRSEIIALCARAESFGYSMGRASSEAVPSILRQRLTMTILTSRIADGEPCSRALIVDCALMAQTALEISEELSK